VPIKSKSIKRSAFYKSPPPQANGLHVMPVVNPLEGISLRETSVVYSAEPAPQNTLAYRDDANGLWLYHGNSLGLLDRIAEKYPEGCFDAIFADPPYFLSNGGISCHAGRMVKVDKGDWDKSRGAEENHNFNMEWLKRCQKVLKQNGTIWI
jgi:site-specific DNA-methyltransferase (adenine-specific)